MKLTVTLATREALEKKRNAFEKRNEGNPNRTIGYTKSSIRSAMSKLNEENTNRNVG